MGSDLYPYRYGREVQPMRPLEGIKVIELAEYVAAPICSRILGELGAEVIKVEPLAQDIMRYTGNNVGAPCSDEENPVFCCVGLNKKFTSISIKTEEGQEIVRKLLKDADVLITGYRQHALEKFGFTYEDVSKLNPRIVMGHVTGYGEDGPDKDLPGFDYTSYVARGGMLYNMTPLGAPEPINSFNAFADNQVGTSLALGIVSALLARDKTGKGDYVAVSLYGTAVFMVQMANLESQYGVQYPKTRKKPALALINTFQCSDGVWIQCCFSAHDKLYNKVMEVIGRPDLKDDPRFSTFERIKASNGQEELTKILEEAIAKKPAKEWDRLFKEADLTAQMAFSFQDINQDEQAYANDFIRRITFANGNPGLVYPLHVKFKSCPNPEITLPKAQGADNEAVLSGLGYSDKDVQELREKKVIT